ncbi:putative ribonuclease H-like domain-containing protein [Tanacetum coccineum]
MDLKWQVAMISIRLKKFYKKTGRKLQFDAKEPVGFDKTKVECFNCHKTGHFARECRSKGNQDIRRRDAGNTGYKAKDNGRRPGKQEEPKALVTLDGDGVDWTGHAEDEQENFALMAYSHSGSDTEVTSCSKECEESYAKLKKLYDEQREQLGDASIEIKAYTLALAKMSVKEKIGLGFSEQVKENELYDEALISVFDSHSSDIEDAHVYDRFAKVKGMHAVPPPMTGNYMPPKSDFGIDESQFTYGLKQSKTSESDAKTSDFDSCESNSSVETLESVSEPVVIEPKVVSQPKVWSDAPIIEEYELDSDDEYVVQPSKEQEKLSFAFVNTVKHVKTPRETIKEQNTCNQSPKVDKRDWNGLMTKKLGLGYGFTRKACFVCGGFSHLIRYCDFHEKRMAKHVELNKKKSKSTGQGENRPVWNNVQRLNHQNKFVPTAVLIRNGRFPVNTARRNFNSQAVSTSAAKKANVLRPIVNDDDPQKTLKGKGIVNSGCSRHMTGNKAYLVEYQEFQGGSVIFGVSVVSFVTTGRYKVSTAKPKLSTARQTLFWNTATSKTVNDVSYNKAKITGKTVSISEASIRRDLLFNDVDGIDCLTNQEIYENLQLMGSKSTSWDQFPTNIASALICLATDRKFNFSKMIFEGMIRNLDAKKKFLMYPRFVQVFLNNQLSNLPAPLDNLPIPVLTKKVFTNMAKQGLHFSGHVTPLFPNMLAQAVVDEGEGSEQPTEPQPTPSPTQPSTGDQPPVTESSSRHDTTQVPRDSLEGTDGSKGDQVLDLQKAKDAQAAEIFKLKKRIKKLEKKCKPSISHHRAWLKSVQRLSMKKRLGKKESVSKQGRKNAKSKPTLDAFDDLDADLAHGMDYMETEEAVNKGRQSNETKKLNLDADTKVIAEDKGSGEKGGSTVSTARPEVDTARPEVDTARPDVDAARQEMKEEKAKEKGVAFKDVEDSSRPARSVLTLKPLPSIDPKDKGKGILVEEEPVKIKRKDQGIDQIERDEELAQKLHKEELAEIARIQEEKAAQEEAARVSTMEMFDEVQPGIDVDALFAAKLQQEEREEYTIEERAKFLAEIIAA